jgi:hypothetical protein
LCLWKRTQRTVWAVVCWTIVDQQKFAYLYGADNFPIERPNVFNPDDILADDWELKD